MALSDAHAFIEDPSAVFARQLRLHQATPLVVDLNFSEEMNSLRRESASQVLVEIKAAAVNPSDAKAATGLMPYATWPRTPGRDFAGVVVDGPAELLHAEVWGSGGELGIRRDGSHASHILLDRASVRRKPEALSMEEAAGIGVPFITALDGLRRAGMPLQGETVLIAGINGKVGQAVAQIATLHGAKVIGLVRRKESYVGHSNGPITIVDTSSDAAIERIRELTGGRGADLIFNTIGSPYFDIAHRSLALGGRQVFITTIEKVVSFNLFEFFRSRHSYIGVDTLALDSAACAGMLDDLKPWFESGLLKPFSSEGGLYGFADAGRAYAEVLGSARPRILLLPGV